MTSWRDFFIGLGSGCALALLVWFIYIIRLHLAKKRGESELRSFDIA